MAHIIKRHIVKAPQFLIVDFGLQIRFLISLEGCDPI